MRAKSGVLAGVLLVFTLQGVGSWSTYGPFWAVPRVVEPRATSGVYMDIFWTFVQKTGRRHSGLLKSDNVGVSVPSRSSANRRVYLFANLGWNEGRDLRIHLNNWNPSAARGPGLVKASESALIFDEQRDGVFPQNTFFEVTFKGKINIRADPSLFAREIGVVHTGDVVQVIRRVKTGGLTWLQINCFMEWDGRNSKWIQHQKAWICEVVSDMRLLHKSDSWHPHVCTSFWKVCSVTDISVRSSPSSNAPILGYRKSREILEIVETRGDWLRMDASEELWVSSRGRSSKHVLIQPMEDNFEFDEWRVIWNGGVSIRSAPSFRAPVVDGVVGGDYVDARGFVRFPAYDSPVL